MSNEDRKLVAPGTLVLAIIFLITFVAVYFLNLKYLSSIWEIR